MSYDFIVSHVLIFMLTQLNFLYSFTDPAKKLSVLPNNCSLAVDTTLVLNCTFVSNPTPNNILWTHNGTALFPESNPNLSQMDAKNYSLLKVYLVSISSSGQYKCIVNNSFGFDQTGSTFITVQGTVM